MDQTTNQTVDHDRYTGDDRVVANANNPETFPSAPMSPISPSTPPRLSSPPNIYRFTADEVSYDDRVVGNTNNPETIPSATSTPSATPVPSAPSAPPTPSILMEESFLSEIIEGIPVEGTPDAPELKRLFYLNMLTTLVQAGSGFAILYENDPNKKYTIVTNFPVSDFTITSGDPFLNLKSEKIFSVSIELLCVAILFLSALHHFITCTVGKNTFEHGIRRNYNIFRWVEYMFSSSLMRVSIAILCGVIDLQMLIMIFGHTAISMTFGLVFELHNSEKRMIDVKWISYWLAFISHIFGWSTILTYYIVNTINNESRYFVSAIVIFVFVLDLIFLLLLGLVWRSTVLSSYANAEFCFILLSLVSKNSLTWISFYGGINECLWRCDG